MHPDYKKFVESKKREHWTWNLNYSSSSRLDLRTHITLPLWPYSGSAVNNNEQYHNIVNDIDYVLIFRINI